jgi:hypothetical protein
MRIKWAVQPASVIRKAVMSLLQVPSVGLLNEIERVSLAMWTVSGTEPGLKYTAKQWPCPHHLRM